MGRPIGTYVTIESPPLKINDPYVRGRNNRIYGRIYAHLNR